MVRFLFSSSYPSRSPRSSLFPTRASWEEENLARVPPCRPIPAASGSLRRRTVQNRLRSTRRHTRTPATRRRLQLSGRRAAASNRRAVAPPPLRRPSDAGWKYIELRRLPLPSSPIFPSPSSSLPCPPPVLVFLYFFLIFVVPYSLLFVTGV
jgi:hypothetical protein